VTVFDSYGKYYDLLYRDKDYAGEAQFIQQLFQTYAPAVRSILELGCGTGKLAGALAEDSYRVHGVDLSAEMLKRAAERQAQLSAEISARLSFSQANIQDLRLGQTFDAVISIFHVLSYQSTESAIQSTLQTVREHLKPGGVFIFDVWYGPAVLKNFPTVRVKRLQDDKIAVTRIAEPVMHPNQNWVDVNYEIFIQSQHTKQIETLSETHRMRYFFAPELEKMLADVNIKLVCCSEWMSDREPDFDTWGVYCVGRV
jgi:SAM-dependent methyltransferase